MDITGKVVYVQDEEPAGEKFRQNFLIETEGEYPKKYAFEIYNRKCAPPRVGDKVKVTFYMGTGREYNGKVYSNHHSVANIEEA